MKKRTLKVLEVGFEKGEAYFGVEQILSLTPEEMHEVRESLFRAIGYMESLWSL